MYFKQNVDEKKRVTGSSGMTWENEMVNLVKKLSKDVKTSPHYNERKNQMLEGRREYIKPEKMKRQKSSTANSGSILTSSEALKSRPKTATNRVSFASDSSEKPDPIVDKESIGVMCDQQNYRNMIVIRQ
mgnify:CR=1 FL=1